MKRVFLFLLPFLLMETVRAYDFSAVSPSGQTLYYNIIAGTNVRVTHPGSNGYNSPYPSGFSKPTGYLVIPSTVTNNGTTYNVIDIKGFSFNGCIGLTAVQIPSSVATIKAYAFYNCTGLDTLYVMRETPPSLEFSQSQGPFEGVNLSNVVLVVPTGSLSAYQTATGWSSFTHITEAGSAPVPVPQPTTHTVTATANNASFGCVLGTGTYPHGATVQLAAVGKRNCTFNQWNDGDTNNPRQLTVNANMALVAQFARSNIQTIHDTVVHMLHDTVIHRDTLVFHDTLQHTDTIFVHDTLQYHDTLMFRDTVTAYIVNYVHDTVTDTIVEYVHDTTVAFVTTYVHDTMYVYSHDTVFAYIPTYIYDTVIAYVTTYVHDTVYQAEHDTLFAYITQYVHDTIVLSEHDTVIAVITQYIHDTTTVVVDHYVFDTIYSTDTLYLYDTVYIHDTVYITQEGIEETEATSVKLYASAGRIVIDGAEGLLVKIYDMSGRMLFSAHPTMGIPLALPVPTSGTYLVRIGNLAARKIVVVR